MSTRFAVPTRLTLSTLAAALLACAAGTALAQDGRTVLKLGAVRYTTASKTTGIHGVGVPAGADAETGDATTLLFTAERLLTPMLGVELALGVPPRIHAKATGSVAFLGDDVLSAKIVAPTLFLNLHLGDAGWRLRPYVGLGVNYTRFTQRESKLASEVSLSDSTGWAAQAGVDWAMGPRWGLFASVAVLQVRSDLVATGTTVLTTTIDFRPVTWQAGASWRF